MCYCIINNLVEVSVKYQSEYLRISTRLDNYETHPSMKYGVYQFYVNRGNISNLLFTLFQRDA